jgi:hypothetical protein
VPTERLKEKADEYVLNGDLSLDMGKAIMATIESERGKQRLVNAAAGAGDDDADNGRISDKLTLADMQAELDKRVELMRAGAAGDGITDQARVFDYIISQLEGSNFLRLMVQASAGTGGQGWLQTMSSIRTPCLVPSALLTASAVRHFPGKSFLLTTVYLWALIKRMKVKAAAPTGQFTYTCMLFGVPSPTTGLEPTRVY